MSHFPHANDMRITHVALSFAPSLGLSAPDPGRCAELYPHPAQAAAVTKNWVKSKFPRVTKPEGSEITGTYLGIACRASATSRGSSIGRWMTARKRSAQLSQIITYAVELNCLTLTIQFKLVVEHHQNVLKIVAKPPKFVKI
ncbi:hypothetical protein B0H11DRAFT_1933016 [Mycena galericulata]|nr:hypothetical protein B0H11DRAFT_1933016 [Mycena galericulata]